MWLGFTRYTGRVPRYTATSGLLYFKQIFFVMGNVSEKVQDPSRVLETEKTVYSVLRVLASPIFLKNKNTRSRKLESSFLIEYSTNNRVLVNQKNMWGEKGGIQVL